MRGARTVARSGAAPTRRGSGRVAARARHRKKSRSLLLAFRTSRHPVSSWVLKVAMRPSASRNRISPPSSVTCRYGHTVLLVIFTCSTAVPTILASVVKPACNRRGPRHDDSCSSARPVESNHCAIAPALPIAAEIKTILWSLPCVRENPSKWAATHRACTSAVSVIT